MNSRLVTGIRSLLLLLPAMSMAGAGPAKRHFYVIHCRLVRTDGTELASPTISAFDRQPCSFIAGGTASTLRHGVTLDYGTSLEAWVAPADDGKLLLDLTVSTTDLDTGAKNGVTLVGATVHTVRTIRSGQPDHIAMSRVGMSLDLTVDDRTP